jgi:DnaJ like chaperone protein
MGYWGKIIGGTAGFFVGGPYGAVIGAAIGHAADTGSVETIRRPFMQGPFMGGASNPARVAGMFGRREEVFAITVTVLAAKLAKCDGPVTRLEIDAFKRNFRIPPESARGIGRLFDQARDRSDSFEPYAAQLAEAFADNRGVLEQVLNSLFNIARADGPLNAREQEFLRRLHRRLGLDQVAWDRAFGEAPRRPMAVDEDDPYLTLGLTRAASGEELHATWKRLMRENHPDSLASRGVPADFIARASDKVARINAAWDRIKRERGL